MQDFQWENHHKVSTGRIASSSEIRFLGKLGKMLFDLWVMSLVRQTQCLMHGQREDRENYHVNRVLDGRVCSCSRKRIGYVADQRASEPWRSTWSNVHDVFECDWTHQRAFSEVRVCLPPRSETMRHIELVGSMHTIRVGNSS